MPCPRIVKVLYTLMDGVMEVVVFSMLVDKGDEVGNAPDNSSIFGILFGNR
jgi:hypothetical protein